jgi:hypothetical protein
MTEYEEKAIEEIHRVAKFFPDKMTEAQYDSKVKEDFTRWKVRHRTGWTFNQFKEKAGLAINKSKRSQGSKKPFRVRKSGGWVIPCNMPNCKNMVNTGGDKTRRRCDSCRQVVNNGSISKFDPNSYNYAIVLR